MRATPSAGALAEERLAAAGVPGGGGCSALGSDAFEQLLGRLVVRLLVDELALEGPLRDRVPKTPDPGVLRRDLRLDSIGDRQKSIRF